MNKLQKPCNERPMLRILSVVSVLCLSACVKYEPARETVYLPGDDPLVNLTFRSLLEREGIDYTINERGFYVSSKENGKAMERLGDEAHHQLRRTSEVELPSQCVAAKLKATLEGEIVLFYDKESVTFLKAATSTWDRLGILEHVASAQFDCTGDA